MKRYILKATQPGRKMTIVMDSDEPILDFGPMLSHFFNPTSTEPPFPNWYEMMPPGELPDQIKINDHEYTVEFMRTAK